MRSFTVATLLLAAALSAASAHAQTGTFQLRGGGFFATADDEFWAAAEDTFTFEKSDLYSGIAGVTFVAPVGSDLAVGFNADVYQASFSPAVRGVTDENGSRVFHTSELTMVPLMVDLRFSPGSDQERGRGHRRGRDDGYRENRLAPYLGAGIGLNVYHYEEFGDFVDFDANPLEVFFDRFEETGTTFAAHALAGLSVPLAREWSLLFEGRYLWSKVDPDGDFAGLGTMDLSGASLQVGVAFHF